MTVNEAILKIKYRIDTATQVVGTGADGKAYEDLEMAIKAFEEYEQYRAIGTVEEFKALKEKNEPKKPYIQESERGDCFECPNCDSFIGYVVDCKDEHYQDNFCPYCSQKLDWE